MRGEVREAIMLQAMVNKLGGLLTDPSNNLPAIMSAEEEQYFNIPPCAACKHQRKRCPDDCVWAPLFPMNRMEEFLAVYGLFGFANVTRMIKTLDPPLRQEAVKSIAWVASSWKQDPVCGPLGLYMKSEERRDFLERRNIFLEQRNSFLEGRVSFLEESARFLLEQDCQNNVVGMAPNDVENNVDFEHGDGQLGLDSSLAELINYPDPLCPLVIGDDQEMVDHGIGVVQDGVVHGRGFPGVNAHFSPELEAHRSYNVAGHGLPPVADPSNNFPDDRHIQERMEAAKDSTLRKE